ncbi:MAG: ABC transporter ATP-binding protein [Tenericutes bacterium]|nr:ABC transporter ATP-binding protein [Mycoplasmatota bacterium]
MKEILKISHLTKYYDKTLAVNDLSLSLEEGEIFGFIGPNGAGKSTTIRAIMNLITKTKGKIYLNGEILDKNNINQKELIGYLPSEVHLYDDLTVKEMLDYHESFYKKNLTKRRKELVTRLQIDETKKIEDLSLGNLKKVGIVLALMHEPKILILDEATSGLDPVIQEEFYNLLKEEKKKKTTIFYSTHILSEISKICDRVGMIKNGTLIKIEEVAELQKKELSFITITSSNIDQIIEELKIKPILKTKDTIKFKNVIEINKLLKILSKIKIDKLLIEPANIEDIFLHYYK